MQRAREIRIVEGPLAVGLARFGIPLALGMALQTTFNLVDAWLIGQLPPGEVGPAVGAIGICDQIAALGTILSFGVSTATGAILAQRRGAGDEAGVRRVAWQSLVVVLGLSIFFGVFGGGFAGFVVHSVIGAKGQLADVATRYLRVMVGGSFTIFFLLQLTSIQRALGSSKTPVALLVFGNVLNVLLAVVFVFGDGPAPAVLAWGSAIARAFGIPRMGMLGAAWATVIARTVALVPNVVVLVRRFDLVPPRGERAPDRAEILQLLDVAWPSSTQFVLRIAGMLLVSSLVARFHTTETDQTATTAMGLVFRLDTMALFVAMGWGSAAQTFVGHNLGARHDARARRAGWLTVGYDALTNVLLVAVVFTWGEAILRVFDDEAAPVAIALRYLHIVAPSYVALGMGVVLGNAMTGAGATRTTLAVDAFVLLVVHAPLTIAVAWLRREGPAPLFACVAVTNLASALAYGLVYARGRWLKRARFAGEIRPGVD